MKNMLIKEFRLALHPACLIFLGLSAMLLIPNYPYYVAFFYMGLGLFFVCLTGRENHDVEYAMLLPIRKRDIVRSRFAMAVCLELAQVVVALPFIYIRNNLMPMGNEVGMDANIALIGLALIMMGLFNCVFFCSYYKNIDKVGKAFIWGSTAVFGFMAAAETAAHAVPFIRDCLDTKDPQFLGYKLATLAVGALVFAALTGLACRRSMATFEKLDL